MGYNFRRRTFGFAGDEGSTILPLRWHADIVSLGV